MNRIRNLMTISALMLILAATGLSLAQQSPEAALRAAIETEMTRGLNAAIEQYKRVVDTYLRTAPVTAAQALLRMADAYEKLGDPRSRAIYEQVVRDFPEQEKVATAARTRLGQSAPAPNEITLKKVFDGAHIVDVSYDGRYLIHYNGVTLDKVVLRDLSTGFERVLESGDSGYPAGDATFSKDGKRAAYGMCFGAGPCEVRIVNLQGSGKPTPQVLPVSEGGYAGPIDWSPDGKWIAVYVRKEQILQVGLIRVSDGTLHVLQSVTWGGTVTGFFSPDSRNFAYSLRMAEDDGAQDIVLMDIEEKRQTPLVTGPSDDSPVGWTPDGRYLLFARNRDGSNGIWAQAVLNRKPQGAPTLLKTNVEGRAAGLTRSGALYLGRRTFSQDLEIVPVDLGSGKITGKPVQIRSAAERTWLPAWSADGRFLAYVLVKNGAENTVGIRSILTGIEREFHLGSTLDRVRSLAWAPDGSFLVGWGRDLKGRYGIYRIDANDGHVSPLVLRDPPEVRNFFWSKDGQKMYYRAGPAITIYEHEGDTDRVFMQWKEPIGSLSPDLRWAAGLVTDDPSGSRALVIRPITGGEPQELLRFDQPSQYELSTQWAPDGRAVMVMKTRGDEKEVLFVPIDGTAPRKLDFDLKRIAEDFPWFTMSPDGRHIAYMVGDDKLEVWVMENLLSSLK